MHISRLKVLCEEIFRTSKKLNHSFMPGNKQWRAGRGGAIAPPADQISRASK